MPRKPYPTNAIDEKWSFAAPYLDPMEQRGHDLREVFNALRWLVRAGAPWRILSNCRIPGDCIDTKRYPLFLA